MLKQFISKDDMKVHHLPMLMGVWRILTVGCLLLAWGFTASKATAQGGAVRQSYSKTIFVIRDLAVEEDYIWAATDGGVVRWQRSDGTSLIYTINEGLVDNEVQAVAIDDTGHLWFGTAKGVSRFDGRTWTTYTTADGLAHPDVRAIALDQAGHLWFATWGGGISEFDGSTWTTYTTEDGLASNEVRTIAIDERGHKWFGFADLYGSKDYGVSKFDGYTWTTYTTADGLAGGAVYAIAVDKAGHMWFGTGGNGVSQFDGRTWTTYTTADGLASNTITGIVVDERGDKWFATNKGVSHFNDYTWTTYTTADGLAHNVVNTISADGMGSVWFGAGLERWTDSQGRVSRFDGRNWTSYEPNMPVSNRVEAITLDTRGRKWVATYKGVSRFDGLTWTSYTIADGLVSNTITDIEIDKEGVSWVATPSGVSTFDGQSWQTYTTTHGLAHNWVNALAVDRAGYKWFGTAQGVSVFDGQSWQIYTTTHGLAHNWVNVIAVDQANNKWFGTQGGGVSMFDGETWTTYTVADGLASNLIYAFGVDQAGHIWVGTNSGLSVFDGQSWTTYTTADGLPYNQIHALAVDRLGYKWLGFGQSGGGVSVFDNSRWTPSPPLWPNITATPVIPAQSFELNINQPRLIDNTAERIYTIGQVAGITKSQTLVLALADERLLARYDLVGRLALDSQNGWLYIEQPQDRRLVVLNTHTHELRTVISLPEAEAATIPPLPQVDPVSGRVMIFRDHVIYIADPERGAIVDTIAFDVRKSDSHSVAAIRARRYDPSTRILYLQFDFYNCHSTASGDCSIYRNVHYDVAAGREIYRGYGQSGLGTILDGYMYNAGLKCYGTDGCDGWRVVLHAGAPWFSSSGWTDGGGQIAFDPIRRRFYEVTEDNLRVYNADTMALVMHLPRPITGTFEWYDPQNNRFHFRVAGHLRTWSAATLRLPASEPLRPSAVPTSPVEFLAVSPAWPVDQTLFAAWADPARDDPVSVVDRQKRYNCNFPSLLYLSPDGGQTWARPTGGIGGSCGLSAPLALSPDYTQTMLASVPGLGIFKSVNGGQLWLPSGAGLKHMTINEILLSPGFADDQTAFAISNLVWPSENLYRSTDAGQTWQPLDPSFLNQDGAWSALALSPEFGQDQTVLALRKLFFNAPRLLYRSRDGGHHWKTMGEMPAGDLTLRMAPLFAKWQTLFAYGSLDNQGILYRSNDSGQTWQVVLTSPVGPVKQLIYAPDVVIDRPFFLLAGEMLYHSSDGGLTWAVFELPIGVVPTALAISPQFARDQTLFVGAADGQVLVLKLKV